MLHASNAIVVLEQVLGRKAILIEGEDMKRGLAAAPFFFDAPWGRCCLREACTGKCSCG